MISKGITPRIFGALFALALGAATQAMAAAPAAQPEVKFGMFTPLTGASSVVGLDMRRGVELALERINAGYDVPLADGTTRKVGPGLLGKPARLLVEDDESRPPAAMDAVRKLVNVDKVAVVLGEYSSGRTLPTGQFTNENKVIQISIGANSPTLREIGPYFFNAIGLASAQGPQLISLAQSEVKAKTVATLFPNNPYGVGVEIATCEAATKAGVACVSKVRYEEQKTDYRPELRQLTAANPDAVIFFAYGADAALILRQAFELGLNAGAKWIGTEVSNWSSDLTGAPQVGEGIRGIEHDVSGPFYETQYAAPYQTKFKEKPTTAFGAFGYDAAMIAALAIDDAKSVNSDAIRASLMKVSQAYKGITGNLAFDKDGMRVSQEYGNFIFTKGALQPYKAASK